jgi:indole-3-acetate monooxygenase
VDLMAELIVEERLELGQSLGRLLPQFRVRAAEGERLATMPADLVEAAKAAGLFRLNLPRSLGGLELDPATTVEIFEQIAMADGSAGWTVVIGNSTAFFAWLDPAVAKEMIGDNPNVVSTSMWAPCGQATPNQARGYEVTGRWPFNSGCPHADWLQVGVLVTDSPARTSPAGRPDWRFAFLPKEAAAVEHTWDALGLRGTGSHHLSIAATLVPPEHLAAPLFEPARHDGPLWRIPLITLAAMFLAAIPLGVARAAIDEFIHLAARKTRGPATNTLASDGHTQTCLARAEAGLLSARAFLFDSIGHVWDTATRGDPPSLDQRAQLLLAGGQAMRAGVAAVDNVFRLAGAEAVLADQPLQRCFRDIHTADQHILFSATREQSYAKLRLGVEQPTFFI